MANLLDNAVKYSLDGSPLKVTVAEAPGEVRVTVADSGPGIPEDHLDHVFERYDRGGVPGRSGSVGLGLFIVRSLAEGHGRPGVGRRRLGGGASITFTFPIRADR